MPPTALLNTQMKGTGGVLPVSAAITMASASATSTNTKVVAAQPRLKVVIRRLAPGLNQTELETALGDEWKPGKGRVEWLLFRPGKVSKEYVGESVTQLDLFKTISQSRKAFPSFARLYPGHHRRPSRSASRKSTTNLFCRCKKHFKRYCPPWTANT